MTPTAQLIRYPLKFLTDLNWMLKSNTIILIITNLKKFCLALS